MAVVVELFVVVVDEVEVLELSQQQLGDTDFCLYSFDVAPHWFHPLSGEVPQQTVSSKTRTLHPEFYQL